MMSSLAECEEFIVHGLTPENLSAVLTWSQQSCGSRWVYREALQYIQDNFMQVTDHCLPLLSTLAAFRGFGSV